MRKLNPKTLEVIEYGKEHPYDNLQMIGDRFDLSRERVRVIFENAGIETTGRNYDGMAVLIKHCPKELVEFVKVKAKGQGLNFRRVTIKLWDMYSRGI